MARGIEVQITTARTPELALTWREKTVVAILLLVARMLLLDGQVRDEIKTLATNVSVHG